MKVQPACVSLPSWLRANLGRGALGVLTGTDWKALSAAVQIVALYAYCGDGSVMEAFGLVVRQMQPSAWRLAYHAIAHVMDWNDRARLWALAGLPPLDAEGQCAFEPRGQEAIHV